MEYRVLEEIQKRVDVKQARLNTILHSTDKFDENTSLKVIQAHNKSRDMWRQRKLMCMDAVEMISDSMEKKTKNFMV